MTLACLRNRFAIQDDSVVRAWLLRNLIIDIERRLVGFTSRL